MKTDAELEQIFDALRDHHHILRCDDVGPGVKLLRSIQIDALRKAREIVDKAVAYYHSQPDNTELDDEVRAVALEKLDKLIRELELR